MVRRAPGQGGLQAQSRCQMSPSNSTVLSLSWNVRRASPAHRPPRPAAPLLSIAPQIEARQVGSARHRRLDLGVPSQRLRDARVDPQAMEVEVAPALVGQVVRLAAPGGALGPRRRPEVRRDGIALERAQGREDGRREHEVPHPSGGGPVRGEARGEVDSERDAMVALRLRRGGGDEDDFLLGPPLLTWAALRRFRRRIKDAHSPSPAQARFGPSACYTGSTRLGWGNRAVYHAIRPEWIAALVRSNSSCVDGAIYAQVTGEAVPPPA